MARFKNFSQWKGRWPHWRADGETYYVSFRHRRPLEPEEQQTLFRALLIGTRRLEVVVLAVFPDRTECLGRPIADDEGYEAELSDEIEKAKRRAAKAIVKRSGERFPPFGSESFDRIMRDEMELQTYFDAIIERPEREGWTTEAEEYEWLFVADSPDSAPDRN